MKKLFIIQSLCNSSLSLISLFVLITQMPSLYSNYINGFNSQSNRLLQLEDGVFNDSYNEIKGEGRKMILNSLIYQTYKGKWSTNSSIPLFTNTNGTAQLGFRLSKRSKRFKGFHYNYKLFLYEGKYNKHSWILSNNDPFWIDDVLPPIYTDIANETVYFSNNQPFCIDDMRYFSIINTKENQGSFIFKFKTGSNRNRTITGIIKIDDIIISFDVTKNTVDYYGDILMLLSLLVIIGIFQLITCFDLAKTIKLNEAEALKYSPHNIIVNCLFNGVISFECLYGIILLEQLSILFIVPSALYFVYSVFFEPKLLLKIIRIHLSINYTEEGIKKELKRRAIRFYIFYLIVFAVFYYLHDLFFWRSFNYFFIGIAFVPQILYNFQSNRKQIITTSYISSIAMNRVFAPLFFKAKDNFLHFEKDYLFSFMICLLMGIEIGILCIQRYHRNIYLSRIIFRSRGYNYYKTAKQLLEINSDCLLYECQICNKPLIENQTPVTKMNNEVCIHSNIDIQIASKDLSDIKNTSKKKEMSIDTDLDLNTQEKITIQQNKELNGDIESNGHNKSKLVTSLCCLKQRKNPLNEVLMITPCNHIFHIDCLQDTIQLSAICFICKRAIPKQV